MASVFTMIYNKEIPGEIVYDDKDVFAILSIEPHNPGHILVIPHMEIANWEDVPEPLWLHTMKVAQDLAKIVKKLYSPPKIALSIVGFDVPHVHVHVFSIFQISDIDHTKAKKTTLEDLRIEADKIRIELNKK
ncbi:MAG TPA: HIT family protein [Candidatus Saccharibacteria bacterium]|nr:HIT family protein [Candidatus Saccharibacteria bacterium]HMT39550.1 HIT family protein [Candidatus Saccharibacteria bacterium]